MAGYATTTTRPCTKCGIRPRHMFPSGQASRCLECLRIQQNDHKSNVRKAHADWEAGIVKTLHRPASAEPCSNCGARARHTYPNGKTISLCKECYNERHKVYKRNRDEAKRKAKSDGATTEMVTFDTAAPAKRVTEEQSGTEGGGTSQAVFGLLSDMLLLMDRSRPAVRDGAIDGLRLELTLQGVRLGMDTAAANLIVKKESV